MTLLWQYNEGILIGVLNAGQASPSPAPASRGSRPKGFRASPRHAKETVRRVRAYLSGRRADLESLTNEAKALTTNEWCAALPEQRNNGKLVYL